MRFCNYEWSARRYQDGDTEGRPTGTKAVTCDLEQGHKGDHQSGKITAPNIRARGASNENR
jgi:hypothetical protein